MKNKKDIALPVQQRGAQLEVDSSDENLVNVIWTTGASVRRYSYENREYYDEVLAVDTSAIRLDRINQGAAPVLNTHSSWSLDDVIGIVEPGSVTIKDGVGRATLRLDDGPETEPIRRKIKAGILRNVSVGYQVNSYQITRTDGATPVYLALDWEPYEISFVPIGADAGAGVRNAPTQHPCTLIENPTNRTMENPMTPEEIAAAQAAERAAAAIAAPTIVDETAIRAAATQAERARTSEITTIVRTARLPDGFTRQTIINDDLDAFTRLPEMFGRAAADLESTTVWGIITANAAMADGTALFHADHGNLAGSGGAIAISTIGAGRKAMRTQNLVVL